MARKKAAAPPMNVEAGNIEDAIRKKFGNVIVNGNQIVNEIKQIIPLCPSLDLAHGGGLQEGSFVTLSGPPRCGKTTTSLHFAAKAQRPEFGKRKVVYLNAEARVEKRDLLGIPGLEIDDPEQFLLVQSAPSEVLEDGTVVPATILTAENYLEIAESFLLGSKNCIIILDSISILCENAEWVGGLGTQTRGGAQKLFAQFTRRMAQVIPMNKHIFIGIVHVYANTSGQGQKWLEKISNSAQYALASKFRCTHYENWKNGETVVGQIVHWKCERSPLGPPSIRVDSYIRYGEGIDDLYEYALFAEQCGMIEKSGTWYTLTFVDGKKKPRMHGLEKVRQYLVDHPDQATALAASLRDSLGLAA